MGGAASMTRGVDDSIAVVVAVVEVGVTAGDARVVFVVAGARAVDVGLVAVLVADIDVVVGAIVVIGIGVDRARARGSAQAEGKKERLGSEEVLDQHEVTKSNGRATLAIVSVSGRIGRCAASRAANV